jgi:uncharacterized protein YjbJ (UPF0337 family)
MLKKNFLASGNTRRTPVGRVPALPVGAAAAANQKGVQAIINWDQIEGKWKQLKGSAKQHFGEFTDNDLETIAGQREKLIGKLQERYGCAKEQAQKMAEDWLKSVKEPSYAPAQHSAGSKQGSEQHATRR